MPQEYRGTVRRLVIAFDDGTTFSGSSYCFLEPGEIPRLYSVTRSVMRVEVRVRCASRVPERVRVLLLTKSTFCRFPGQELTAGSPKVPSIIYYDNEGASRAAGAEVNIAENVEKAEDEGWMKAEWCAIFLR